VSVVLLSLAARDAAAAAEDVASKSVTVNVNLATRTSLMVSSRVLQFEVTRPGGTATAALEFSAGMRMPAGSDRLCRRSVSKINKDI
jgi:hypothetical protein